MRLSMDHQLKQWRFLQQQQQSDRPSAKVARCAHAQKPSEKESHPGISLFVREPSMKRSSTNMSAVPAPEPFGGSYKMGPFTFSQWQELKHQALIYKYMLVGAVIPLDLIQPIRNSVLHSYHHQQNPHFHNRYHHHQPSTLQSGYWGRALGDSEPGRCRRTDGKKWRCSRDVVTGQKYCERHVHRGKNRSRKPVETSPPVPSVTPNAFSVKNTLPSTLYPPHASSSSKPRGSCFPFFDPSPSTDPFQLNLRSREGKMVNGPLMQNHQEKFSGEDSPGTGKVLRHFFDEWPTNPASSSSHRSVSISSNPDFSLKLFTGDVQNSDNGGGGYRRKPAPLASNWGIWENHNQEGSVGGPLAEALRSSGSSSSPTSVLQPKAKCSISESGSVSN